MKLLAVLMVITLATQVTLAQENSEDIKGPGSEAAGQTLADVWARYKLSAVDPDFQVIYKASDEDENNSLSINENSLTKSQAGCLSRHLSVLNQPAVRALLKREHVSQVQIRLIDLSSSKENNDQIKPSAKLTRKYNVEYNVGGTWFAEPDEKIKFGTENLNPGITGKVETGLPVTWKWKYFTGYVMAGEVTAWDDGQVLYVDSTAAGGIRSTYLWSRDYDHPQGNISKTVEDQRATALAEQQKVLLLSGSRYSPNITDSGKNIIYGVTGDYLRYRYSRVFYIDAVINNAGICKSLTPAAEIIRGVTDYDNAEQRSEK